MRNPWEGTQGVWGAGADPWAEEVAGDADLDRVIEDLASGRGRLILVTGERGAGRSRRAMRLLDRARSVCDVAFVGHHGSGYGDVQDATVESGPVGGAAEEDGPGGGAAEEGGPGGKERAGRGPDATAGDRSLPKPVSAFSSAALGSLVRALARTRPDGPAARLVAETAGDPMTAAQLAEEMALVLVAEAARHPVTLLVEDIDRAEDGTVAFVDHLRAAFDAVPLLVVVTATTGWGARGPGAGCWRSWVGRHAVLHVPVMPPPRAQVAAAVRQVCLGLPAPLLDGVLRASRGNPRIAQELALWSLEGAPPQDLPDGCLVRELVAAHDDDAVLTAIAVADMPVGVRLITTVTSASCGRVREVLDRAAAVGLVERQLASGWGDTWVMTHPMYAAAARTMLPEEPAAALHLAIADALIAEQRDDPAAAPDIVRHLIASGRPRGDLAVWCLRAADWHESAGRLREAAEHAQTGLDQVVDLPVRTELVDLLSRCYRRLGESRSAVAVLRAAVRLTSGQPRYRIPLVIALLELDGVVDLPDREELLAEARAGCPAERQDLLARLAAVEAAFAFRIDPVAGCRAAERAIRIAEAADDRFARVRALAVASRALMDPAHVGELERVSSWLLQEPVVDGLAGCAAAALACADRGRLDTVLREYVWRESRRPEQVTRDELTLLRASVAALEGRQAVLIQALLHLSTTTDPRVAVPTSLLPVLWSINTRGSVHVATPDLTGMPGAEAAAELQWLGRLATKSTALHPVEVDLVRRRLGDPGELIRRRDGTTWSVRLAAAAVFGAVNRDRELCAAAVQGLEPFVDQFVMVWPFLPIGPVGWFLAGALRVLGRHEQAVAALSAAQKASENLVAPGWILRTAVECSRLTTGARPGVEDLVRTTIGPAAARRFPGVVVEIQRRLDGAPESGPAVTPSVTKAGQSASGAVQAASEGAVAPSGTGGPGPSIGGVPSGVPGGSVTGPQERPGPDPSAAVQPGTAPQLTSRECEIVALAAVGCTNKEIAKRLYLSVATVERHFTNLYRRLGARNRAQALGILSPLGFPEASQQ